MKEDRLKTAPKLRALLGVDRPEPTAHGSPDNTPGDPFISLGTVVALTGHDMHGRQPDGGGNPGYVYKD